MKTERSGNGCLRIWLTDQDMAQLGVTFEQMDENDPHTRSALTRLLLSVGTGMPVNGDMVIEALPLDGGCLLLITPMGKRHSARPKTANGPYIYTVADAERLLALAQCCKSSQNKMPVSSLYQLDNTYRLILYPDISTKDTDRRFFEEYADEMTEGEAAAAFIGEHGKVLAVSDALERLCAAL